MKVRVFATIALIAFSVSGCTLLDHAFCSPRCESESHSSSSLVNFLYPNGQLPPREDSIPELRVPLRVGLAFLPPQNASEAAGLPAASRDALLERIRQRFADRKFVSDIVMIPDYYLKNVHGYEGLQGVQRLHNVDVMALVSYDQVAHLEDNSWSLGYVTIVGAYVLKGSRHEVTTLVDLAVIDPASRSLVLRAGGTDTNHGNTTLIEQERAARAASGDGFSNATNALIENFDSALKKFESDVKAGTANVKIVQRNSQRVASSGGGGGGGAWSFAWLGAFTSLIFLRRMAGKREVVRIGNFLRARTGNRDSRIQW
jgi:rhombotail lipoprotein